MGRRTAKDEQLIAEVVKMSWNIIGKALKSKKRDDKEKKMIAMEIVKKTCPQQVKTEISADDDLLAAFRGIHAKRRKELSDLNS